jgi:hypothetical protein
MKYFHAPFKQQHYLHNIYFEIVYGGCIEMVSIPKSLKMDEPKIGMHCLSNLWNI